VPEPELTLVISPALKLVGFTIGNDMSARDIEGENPLYLPQAKVYRQSCAVGPCVLVPEHPVDVRNINVVLRIDRDGGEAFRGATNLNQMARTFENLIEWLGRENEFPEGVLLLTGTGIVPPDDFTLHNGDLVSIEITGIGTLTNPVVQS
jgi:2-dehydro-3-deoxy-D-arabinonate dehydratase